MKKELYEIWKEMYAWKLQMPKGILTFRTKFAAIEFIEKYKELLKWDEEIIKTQDDVKFIVGKKYFCRSLERVCFYTEACDYMMKNNIHDSTSIFLDFSEKGLDTDIKEVTKWFIQNIYKEK